MPRSADRWDARSGAETNTAPPWHPRHQRDGGCHDALKAGATHLAAGGRWECATVVAATVTPVSLPKCNAERASRATIASCMHLCARGACSPGCHPVFSSGGGARATWAQSRPWLRAPCAQILAATWNQALDLNPDQGVGATMETRLADALIQLPVWQGAWQRARPNRHLHSTTEWK